jgi:alpha-glucosidase
MSHASRIAAASLITLLVAPPLARSAFAAASSFRLLSPDGRIEVRIASTDRLRYDVLLGGQPLLKDATLSLSVGDLTLGLLPKVKKAVPTRVDREVEPVVRRKSAKLRERYNQVRLELQGGHAVTFRAYDEGVAYRFETALPGEDVKVRSEEATFAFAGPWDVYYPREESFFSHNEREYARHPLAELGKDALASLPAVVVAPGGVKVAVAESDLQSYPGLWLRGTSGPALAAAFPAYPLEEKLERDRDLKVTKRADYIAVTHGTRTYPWRVLGIAEKDGDLLTSSLVWLLEAPSKLADTSWIRPGKVAWDWWNANNVFGVDFKSGVNTRTYEYYVDFAAGHGIEYVILDEGWYVLGNVLEVVPALDMEELSAYARQKGVGLVLWVVWKSLGDHLEEALDRWEKWGIKGIKVDFMQRDDQPIIDYYARVCREAARRHMLVDFHGGQKPALMTRTWPNLISTEGVRGLEQAKWSEYANPEHDVTIPFTRMFLGPMDYTPGAMVNAAKGSFAPLFQTPMSMGTRCHQLAMYVVYESPLQMLADSPSRYLREPEAMEFLTPVPTVWDETRVLAAELGDYVAVARRHGRDWYVGAMTDWTARDLDLELSFLPEGSFTMTSWADGVNADRFGSDYRRSQGEVSSPDHLSVHLAPGGGWVARIVPRD